jgi:hypothetical protein
MVGSPLSALRTQLEQPVARYAFAGVRDGSYDSSPSSS